jgi:hypothetical protein
MSHSFMFVRKDYGDGSINDVVLKTLENNIM